jgi:hypothetical protein
MGIIDKTRYGIIAVAPYTESGHAELQATFIMKKTALDVLKRAVPNPKERLHRYKIVRMETLPEGTKWVPRQKNTINPIKREALLASVRADMLDASKSLMGSGYVDSYYESVASDFAAVAESLVNEIENGVWS